MRNIILYDKNMVRLAILENAVSKGYTKKLNDIWQAKFSLPANDPKAKLCTPFSIIELFDGEERVDLFRILPSNHSSDESSDLISFECEHVLATLTDDLLFQYHEQVNLTTTQVLNYILARQSSSKWRLGTVDFAYQFSYKWESENLLASLFSVPQPFLDDYQWTWDTTTKPWILNLIRPSTEIKTWIRYGRNLKSIEKRTDPTDLCTRLYGLGYGEGVNQLTITEVNGGIPYLDADTIGVYGVMARVFTDTKEENATTLKAKMQAFLNELKIPRTEYALSAVHLYQITDNSIDDFYLGSMTRVVDKVDDLSFNARVVSIAKDDIDGDPGGVDLEIANKTNNIAKSISGLANRQRISEVYSQGATHLMSQDFADNADATYPALLKFYIPEETVRINKMELNFKTTNFRAYSKSVATSATITQTTGGGGANTTTSSAGGDVSTSTGSGGGDYTTSETAYESGITTATQWSPNPDYFAPGSGGMDTQEGHYHRLHLQHQHDLTTSGHDHNFSVPDHNHSVAMPSHTHVSVIPGHTHDVILPGHTHAIEYGILLAPNLPTDVVVFVDNHQIPGSELNRDNLNIIPYLDAGADGKVRRGTWHEIKIMPTSLARIEANIISQIFIQSRGGGNY